MESDSRSGSPRLLVLGAGPAQLGLLEAARARGLWVAVVDRDPGAPGFPLADRRCILSTEDEPAIERLVGALGIDGIIAPGTDWPVGVAARIAERAGTAASDLVADRCARDQQAPPARAARRSRCAAAAFLGRRGRRRRAGSSRGPVVVKAPDRQGQKGLTLVSSPAGLPPAIEVARSAVPQRPRARRGAGRRPRGDGDRVLGRRSRSRRSPSRTGSRQRRRPSVSRSHMSGRASPGSDPGRGRTGRGRARDRERPLVHPAPRSARAARR